MHGVANRAWHPSADGDPRSAFPSTAQAQEVRQGLLAQHLELERRIAAILESAADTVQSCAR